MSFSLTLSFGRILLACMKFLGCCPCPRCLVEKDNIDRLGSKHDRSLRTNNCRMDSQQRQNWIERVRKMIFKKGRGVTSQAVEGLIGAISLVPIRVRRSLDSKLSISQLINIQNAFSEKLSAFGFNFYQILVPDFMHEFELGVWKATLMHLL